MSDALDRALYIHKNNDINMTRLDRIETVLGYILEHLKTTENSK